MRRFLKALWPRPRQTRAEAVVLMFHRVAAPPIDPFGLAVTPQAFELAVEALRLETDVLSPGEFIAMSTGGYPPGRYSLITFDDGYEDVVTNGLPILSRQGVGAALYIPSRIVHDPAPFWWDLLAEIILASSQLPEQLHFNCDGQQHQWDLPVDSRTLSASEVAFLIQWRWGQPDGESPRACLFNETWTVLQQLQPDHRDTALADLANQAGLNPHSLQTGRLASPDQLIMFSRTDKCALGSHTINHVRLSALTDAQQKQEIVDSKAELSTAFGTEITMFSYPHGGPDDFTNTTTALVRQAGYQLAFSTLRGRVEAGVTNPHIIPRLYLHNGSVPGLRSTIQELFDE